VKKGGKRKSFDTEIIVKSVDKTDDLKCKIRNRLGWVRKCKVMILICKLSRASKEEKYDIYFAIMKECELSRDAAWKKCYDYASLKKSEKQKVADKVKLPEEYHEIWMQLET
jgi:hypothetical protein